MYYILTALVSFVLGVLAARIDSIFPEEKDLEYS